MSKTKIFIENFLVYGLGGIISKAIPLVMVPVVTRMMPGTFYFGLNDLILTITSFASAFAIMGMYDAMYRMFFEKLEVDYRKTVCSTALMFVSGTTTVMFFFLVIFREEIARFFFEDSQYAYLVYFSAMATLVGATNSIISAPTQMQNQRRIFLVMNTVGAVLSYGVAIPLLLEGYYAIALPLATIVSGLTLNVSFCFLNRDWFSVRLFDFALLRQLLAFGVPIAPAFFVYWIFHSCDRVMIGQFLDVGAVGIYAVGAKLGQASQLIYTAFSGGWKYFVFSTMREENQVESNSAVHEYLAVVAFLAGMWMCGLALPLFSCLFPTDYISGYIVAPYLFFAPLILMLYQAAATQFAVIRKNWPSTLILSFGAVANVGLNYLLIPCFGIEGAAIATLLGYVVSDSIGMIVLCRMRLMVVSRRFFAIVGVTVIYFVVWRLWLSSATLSSLGLAFFVSLGFVYLYKRELTMLAIRAKAFLAARRKND